LSLSSSAFYSTSEADQFTSPNIENARKQIIAPSFGNEDLLPAAPAEGGAEEESEETPEGDSN
jgi:preprotein translocase subunit SecG